MKFSNKPKTKKNNHPTQTKLPRITPSNDKLVNKQKPKKTNKKI